MTFVQRKLAVFATWMIAVMIFGVTVAADKPDLWLLITAVAIIPVLIGHRLWELPEPTLSEIIVRARSRS